MSKCIVCGCTDERACPEGCSWSVHLPPVCSSCVETFMIARLWSSVQALVLAGGKRAVRVAGLNMELVSRLLQRKGRRQLETINRRSDKWTDCTPKPRRRK